MSEHQARRFHDEANLGQVIRERTIDQKVDVLIVAVSMLEAQLQPWHPSPVNERISRLYEELADVRAQLRGLTNTTHPDTIR